MQPGQDHDVALPRPSYEGPYGTIYCSRCDFFGLGYNHPEWWRWEWLKQSGAADHSLQLIELGALVVESFEPAHPVYRSYPIVVRLTVDATDENEAKLIVERLLAGKFHFDFVASVETSAGAS